MANRESEYGMDVAIARRLNSKYDPNTEREVLEWIHALTGDQIPMGRENAHMALKSGVTLCKLINAIYNGTPNIRPEAQRMKKPAKFSAVNTPFKQMENIDIFLNYCEAYGVPRNSLFQTVDLYECRNMAQVLNCILQLGTECQRYGFNGPVCGPRPTSENRRVWTEEQLKASNGILSLQSGTNKYASQKGMTFGASRHIADIRCDDICPESHGILSAQMGTNQYASQRGMKMGASRHIADIRCDNMTREGQGVIGLQMGSNKGANQSGMKIGGVRHIADIPVNEMTREGQAVINLQYGTNQLASQKGMRLGGQRGINDMKIEQMTREGTGIVGLQMGPSQNQVASQSGMSFGAQRHIMDSH